MDKPKIVPNFSDKPITNLNKTVTTVTAIKAVHNYLSLEKIAILLIGNNPI